MAHPESTRIALRRSFVRERLDLEAAASKHGVSYHTARIWKKKAKENGDDWDRARAAVRIAEGGVGDATTFLIEDFVLLFQSTIDQINEGDFDPLKKADAIAKLSDAYTKTMKAASRGDPNIARMSIALQVLQLLAEFIKDNYKADLERFTVILEKFAGKVSEAFA